MTSVRLSNQIDKITSCSICLETFKEPKILPCIHTFCLRCLDTYCKDKNPGEEETCPFCRKIFTIPPDGMLVLPSLESILFSSWRLIDWYRKEGVKPDRIPDSELNYFSASKRKIIEGIIHIDGVPTKHFSEPELRVLMEESGLAVTALERLEYDWNTEFPEPPRWMKAPYPWDWLVECKNLEHLNS